MLVTEAFALRHFRHPRNLAGPAMSAILSGVGRGRGIGVVRVTSVGLFWPGGPQYLVSRRGELARPVNNPARRW